MYTQCPQCLTYFQVTPEHLKVAQGNVRCGQCRNVFSALGNLTELPPEAVSQSIPAPEPKAATSSNRMSAAMREFERDLADEDEPVAKPPSNTGLGAAIEKINQLNKRSGQFQSLPKAPAKPARDTSSVEAPKPMPQNQATSARKPGAKTRAAANDPAPPPVTPTAATKNSAKSAAAANRQNAEDQPTPPPTQPARKPPTAKQPKRKTATPKAQDIDVDAALSAIDDLDISAERALPDFISEVIDDSENEEIVLSEQHETMSSREPDTTPKVKHLDRPQPSRENQQLSVPSRDFPPYIPRPLLEDYQRAKAAAIFARQHARGAVGWIIGCVALMIVFLGQTIYFKYNELARISALRPWMEQFCQFTHCEISLPFEVKKMELLGQDIRSHPKIGKALLVSVTLINRSTQAQAYPGLQITFSDMNAQKIAMRRFIPKEYLAPGVNIDTGMPANTPIAVELQLLDPGSNAINFEFEMFRAS